MLELTAIATSIQGARQSSTSSCESNHAGWSFESRENGVGSHLEGSAEVGIPLIIAWHSSPCERNMRGKNVECLRISSIKTRENLYPDRHVGWWCM